MRCNCYLSSRDGTLELKSLTRPGHRSIPFRVMRYVSLLLLLLVFTAAAERAYSQSCPVVVVSCPKSDSGPGLTFSANVSGTDPSVKLTFNWVISAGKITSGQHTPSIIIDTTGLGGISFTATVEVGGIPNKCGNKASCSIVVCDLVVARKFDEYGSETKALVRTRPRSEPHRKTRRVTNKGKAST